MLNLLFVALLAQSAPAAQGTLTFTAPAAWTSRPAASSMRVAEYVIPHAGGDSEDAELILYYFGGQGGSASANIDRWIGQIQPDGQASAPVKTTKKVNGMTVSTVDVAGTYVAEVRPGSTERYNKPGFRLRAAVVETPRGPYYIKMTGPSKTMAAAAAGFDAFVASLGYRP
jgi:hypothetical protein